jgi:hypothetical protein
LSTLTARYAIFVKPEASFNRDAAVAKESTAVCFSRWNDCSALLFPMHNCPLGAD